MNMGKGTFALLAAGALMSSHLACKSSNTKTDTPAPVAVSKAEQRGTARVIRLPKPDIHLPDGPNKQLVMVQCGMCHTPQYITLQPPFSKETWTAEITKMRTTYGGPIPEEQVPQILEYLVAVNGAK